MWYIVAFISLLIVGVLDGHTSSFAALFLMYVLGLFSLNSRKDAIEKAQGGKVFGIVFSVYVISALIASHSFLNGQYFYVSDSMKYLETYSNVTFWSWRDTFSHLSNTYFSFSDDNGLYNDSLAFWSYIGNHYFDGASVLFMTLFQTLFGFLSLMEIFKIYSLYFVPRKAACFTCTFAVFSLFHIYSIVIIRDIVIAFFYMLGLRKILSKPRVTDVLVLILVLIAAMGIRLYTGLFFGAFIMLWLYKLLQDTRYANYKFIIIPIIIVGVAFITASFASSVLIENTTEQISGYDDLYEREGGIASSLRNLPVGVRHIVLLFFSQLPLDSLQRLSLSSSFSNYYLSILAIIFKVFGFVVFYGLIYTCFIKGFFKRMTSTEKWIVLIMLVFVALNMSTHIDVRRSMEAIPFFYLFYILYGERTDRKHWHRINRALVAVGIVIMLFYAIM